MRRLFFLPLPLALAACGGGAPPDDASWAHAYGASAFSAARAVAASPAGDVVLAGSLRAGPHGVTADLGGGTLPVAGLDDAFVAKLDPDGHVLWSKAFGSPDDDFAVGVGTDASGAVFLAGQVSGSVDLGGGPLPAAGPHSMFVVKLDAGGHHLWSRGFPGHDGSVQAITDLGVDPAGDVVLRGELGTEPLDFGAGPLFPSKVADTKFLAKLRGTDGGAVWSRTVETGAGFAVGPKREIVVGANYPATVGTDGGVVEGGTYLTKLDADGATMWTKPIQPLYWFFATSANAIDVQGNITTAGECLTQVLDTRWCVQSYDPGGAFRWNTELGNSDAEDTTALLAMGPGGQAVTTYGGFGESEAAAYPFAREVGPDGALRWSLDLSVAGEFAGGVAFDPQGAVLLAGALTGTIDLGTGPVPAGGPTPGIFVAKLAP